MNLRLPKKLAKIGGTLIILSGIVNVALGVRVGAVLYDAYPGGRMGHVGILAGVAAFVIGLIIVLLVAPIYDKKNRGIVILAAILTIVLGHVGAIAGAIYIGTVGVVLCYVAGLWALVAAATGLGRN